MKFDAELNPVYSLSLDICFSDKLKCVNSINTKTILNNAKITKIQNEKNLWLKILELDDPVEEIKMCNKILQTNKNNFDALRILIRSYIKQKNLEKAKSILKQIEYINSHSENFFFAKGDFFSYQEYYDEAIIWYKKAIDINKDNDKLWYNLGRTYEKNNKLIKALECFENQILLNPKDASSLVDKAYILLKLERFEESITIFDTALKIEKTDANIIGGRGYASFLNANYTDAIFWFDLALKYSPQNYNLLNMKAASLDCNGDSHESLWYYQKALQIDSERYEVYNDMGLAYQKLNNYKDSEKCFKKAISKESIPSKILANYAELLAKIKKFDESKKFYEKALEKEPDDIYSLYRYSVFLYGQSQNKSAIKYFKKILELDQKQISKYPRIYDFIGHSYESLGDYYTAIEFFNLSLNYFPQNAIAMNGLGLSYFHLQDYKNSEKWYISSLEQDPKLSDALTNYGSLMGQIGNFSKAHELFDKSLDIERDEITLYCKGVLYTLENNHNKAIEFFKSALDKNPQYFSASLNLGLSYMQIGDYENLLLYSKKKISSSEIEYLEMYCYALFKLKNFTELNMNIQNLLKFYNNEKNKNSFAAVMYSIGSKHSVGLELINSIIEIEPTKSSHWTNKGFILMNMGKFQESLLAFDRSLKLDPNNYNSLLDASYALENLNRNEESLEFCHKALKINPQNLEIKKRIEYLSK